MSFCTLSLPFKRTIELLSISRNVKDSVESVLAGRIPLTSYYIECNGRIVSDDEVTVVGRCYHVQVRLPGGKGGFGSMLRALGAQIEKTTNREACRDLSGRRMRDINNEKKLREWAAKSGDREKAKEERRKERRERMKAGAARHKFDDPTFDKQKTEIAERLDDALEQGLAKASSSSCSASTSGSQVARKRKAAPASTLTDPKKARDWLGLDNEACISSSSDSESAERDVAMHCSDDQPSTSSAPAALEKPESCTSSSSSSDSRDGEFNNGVLSQDGILEEMESEHFPGGKQDELAMSSSVADNSLGGKEDIGTAVESGGSMHESVAGRNMLSCTDLSEVVSSSTDGKDASSKPCKQNKQDAVCVSGESINLDAYPSVESLQSVGLDVLKQELMSRGLKCGGTLEQRAQRLFAVRGLTNEQIDPSMFAKPGHKKK